MGPQKRMPLLAAIVAAMATAVATGSPAALADPAVSPPGPNDPGAVGPPPLDVFVSPPSGTQTSPPAEYVDLPNPFTPPPADQPVDAVDVPAGQNPTPFDGQPVFAPPSFNPSNGAVVGVAKPIIINFARPIADRPMAERAIHISSVPPVPGKFYWMSSTQVRWRPINFWPANTVVNIDASGARSSFRTGDSLVAVVDDKTHQMTITRNGNAERTFPVSMGKPDGKHETKNGTYYVLEKFADIVMDSSTYGVPVNSPEGYKLNVQDAVRIDNSGIFVHSAPWSVADQGKRNVSHGCINLSPTNAQWFYDNFGSGDPVIVKNSVGIYNQPDGAQDWQI